MTALSPSYRAAACQSRLFAALPTSARSASGRRTRYLPSARNSGVPSGRPRPFVAYRGRRRVKLYRIAPNGTEAVVGVMTRGQSWRTDRAARRYRFRRSGNRLRPCRRTVGCAAVPDPRPTRGCDFHPVLDLPASSAWSSRSNSSRRGRARSGGEEFLLDLCPDGAEAATVTLPYDKVLIAGRLGMKPESLSRAFARLRDHGVRVTQSSAAIASVAALRDLAHADPAETWARAV